jgi:WD40 repeat protein
LLAVPTSTGLAIWDVSQRRQLSQWNPAYFDKIWSIGWSPDASRLAVVYKEVDYFGKSRRMSFQTCSLLDRHCQEIATIGGMNATFSPSGDRIATVYKNTTIFDGETGDFLADLPSRVVSLSSGRQAIFFSPDGVWLLHNGIVHQRTRSERWYGVYELPPFWGLVLFLSALIVQMAKSIPLPRRSIASPLQQ